MQFVWRHITLGAPARGQGVTPRPPHPHDFGIGFSRNAASCRSPPFKLDFTILNTCQHCCYIPRPARCITVSAAADTRQLVEEECKSSKVKPHPMFDPDSVMARPKPTAPIALVTFNSVDRCGDACGSLSGTRYGGVPPALRSVCSTTKHLALGVV